MKRGLRVSIVGLLLQNAFSFLPDWLAHGIASVLGLFVGDGWHLTLGLVFMLIVIFLPGGIMEGISRLWRLVSSRTSSSDDKEKEQPSTKWQGLARPGKA